MEAEEALMAERAGSDRELRHPAQLMVGVYQTVVGIKVEALADDPSVI